MIMESELVTTSPITKTHLSIADKFVNKIIGQLESGYKVKKYSVESDYYETEFIEVDIGESYKISIHLRTNK